MSIKRTNTIQPGREIFETFTPTQDIPMNNKHTIQAVNSHIWNKVIKNIDQIGTRLQQYSIFNRLIECDSSKCCILN